MLKSFINLFTSSLTVFSEERRRSLSRDFEDLLQKVDAEEAKRFPHFNRDRLYRAQKNLENFMAAYQKEFDLEMGLIAKKLKRVGDTNNV